ncbi:MAG: type II toxin-antitoxin system Phd/YefM family antitoxin [Acidobacteriota bacterium]
MAASPSAVRNRRKVRCRLVDVNFAKSDYSDSVVVVKKSYSTYEAKAKLSEILRSVRRGQSVAISYHGETIAEIRPVSAKGESVESRLEELRFEGVLGPPAKRSGPLRPLRKRPGALKRFLDSRK